MTAKQAFYTLIGVLVAVILMSAGVLVFGNKMLVMQSGQLSDLRLQTQVLDQQQSNLIKAKQDVVKYTPLNNIAQSVVPQDKDQALTVREIVSFAQNANITISSITFPASNLGGTTVNGSSGTSSQVSGGAITLAPSQLTPVSGLSGIYVLPITVESDVSKPINYNQLSSFLQALEQNRHTAEVSQLTITPANSGGSSLSFQLVINAYIKR